MPPTLDVRMFLLTIALLPLYIFAAKKVGDRLAQKQRSNPRRKWEAWTVIALGLAYIALMASQLRLIQWDRTVFAGVFTWFCAHGIPALLVGRMVSGMARSFKGANASTS